MPGLPPPRSTGLPLAVTSAPIAFQVALHLGSSCSPIIELDECQSAEAREPSRASGCERDGHGHGHGLTMGMGMDTHRDESQSSFRLLAAVGGEPKVMDTHMDMDLGTSDPQEIVCARGREAMTASSSPPHCSARWP